MNLGYVNTTRNSINTTHRNDQEHQTKGIAKKKPDQMMTQKGADWEEHASA
jgi:hypothetical protein